LQATQTCKSQRVQCQGGKYDPAASPRRAEHPPRYNAGAAGVNPGPLNHVTIATMGRRTVRWTTAV
jgi:hypothetical protein